MKIAEFIEIAERAGFGVVELDDFVSFRKGDFSFDITLNVYRQSFSGIEV